MTASRRDFTSADVLLLAVAVVWGTSYGVAKQTLWFYPALGVLALRFGISFILLSPCLTNLGRTTLRDIGAASATGLMLLAVLTAEMSGIALTTAANAAFLISLCVGFTPLAEWAVLKRCPRGSEWLTAILSVAGAAMLSGDGAHIFNTGDALIVFAAVLRALNACLAKRVMQRSDLASSTLTALQSGVVAAGSIAVALIVPGTGFPPLPSFGAHPGFWANVLYLSVACTLFAFFAQNYALKRCSPTRASLLMGSEPAFGAVFACVFLGESVSVMGWLGGGLIVSASVVAAVRVRMPKRFQDQLKRHRFGVMDFVASRCFNRARRGASPVSQHIDDHAADSAGGDGTIRVPAIGQGEAMSDQRRA